MTIIPIQKPEGLYLDEITEKHIVVGKKSPYYPVRLTRNVEGWIFLNSKNVKYGPRANHLITALEDFIYAHSDFALEAFNTEEEAQQWLSKD